MSLILNEQWYYHRELDSKVRKEFWNTAQYISYQSKNVEILVYFLSTLSLLISYIKFIILLVFIYPGYTSIVPNWMYVCMYECYCY